MRRVYCKTLTAQRAYDCAAALLRREIYPGPRLMHEILRGWSKDNLNGEECTGRRRALEDAGWSKDALTGRWRPPKQKVVTDGR